MTHIGKVLIAHSPRRNRGRHPLADDLRGAASGELSTRVATSLRLVAGMARMLAAHRSTMRRLSAALPAKASERTVNFSGVNRG
jgi:hypothetical protein